MADVFKALRPLIFRLDAERAHWLTVRALAAAPAAAGWIGASVADPVECLGLRFPNRVGLAAGMDKDARAVNAFARLGFGFVEVGTLTPRPQPGNPRPRIFRDARARAVINRLGFNNEGIDAAVRRLEGAPRECVVGVNIGKNRDTPVERAAEDYVYCLRRAHATADYITVNVSSPNTPGLRDLQEEQALIALLDAITAERERIADAQGARTPVLLKVAPDLADATLRRMALAARERGIDGLIATNTTIERPAGLSPKLAAEAGGLSGPPLAPLATQALRSLRAACGPDFPIIGVGGIDSAPAALQRIAQGADLIQIYTAIVYEGPGLPARLARALRDNAP